MMQEYLVIVPDKANNSARAQIRDEHLKAIKPLVEKGVVTMGGATLGEDGEMNGSALTIVADSRDDVMRILENDVYAKKGAW